MKKLQLTILALVIILSTSIAALADGTGEIKGQIIDSLTGDPIIGATVSYTVAGTLCGTVTDFDGYFKIKPLKPGYYDLTFRYVGYNRKSVTGVRVTSDKFEDVGAVKLASGNIITHTVIGYVDKLIDPEDPTAIPLGFEDIKMNVNRTDPMSMIATMSAEIKTSGDGKKLYFRGERAEAVQYIVDGVKTRNGNLGIPSSAIGHMTVYTGGIPAKYGDVTGGVVVIETRGYFDVLNERSR